MPSLDDTFQELLDKLRQPEALNAARIDPFFYFVHDPGETLQVKKNLTHWIGALAREGWKVECVSLSDLLWKIVDSSGRWQEWLALEPDADPPELNRAVGDVVRREDALVKAVAQMVSADRPRTIVFLTDAATLHPYFRVRILENALHDQVKTPTVLFYPGRRMGQYGLRFLGTYKEDGNYRACIIGGLS